MRTDDYPFSPPYSAARVAEAPPINPYKLPRPNDSDIENLVLWEQAQAEYRAEIIAEAVARAIALDLRPSAAQAAALERPYAALGKKVPLAAIRARIARKLAARLDAEYALATDEANHLFEREGGS